MLPPLNVSNKPNLLTQGAEQTVQFIGGSSPLLFARADSYMCDSYLYIIYKHKIEKTNSSKNLFTIAKTKYMIHSIVRFRPKDGSK